ncbi:MAG: DUF805 domain-containing protein [Lachnospiraceae bacterium]
MLESYKQSWLRTFQPKGRMCKKMYNQAMLLHMLLAVLPFMATSVLGEEHPLFLIWGVFVGYSFFPIVSSTIQRMHDVGKSGWTCLLYFILIYVCAIGFILFAVQFKKEGVDYENKWGKPEVFPEADDLSDNTEAFVDERVTEQDVKNKRKQLLFVLLKITGVYLVICVLTGLLSIF